MNISTSAAWQSLELLFCTQFDLIDAVYLSVSDARASPAFLLSQSRHMSLGGDFQAPGASAQPHDTDLAPFSCHRHGRHACIGLVLTNFESHFPKCRTCFNSAVRHLSDSRSQPCACIVGLVGQIGSTPRVGKLSLNCLFAGRNNN